MSSKAIESAISNLAATATAPLRDSPASDAEMRKVKHALYAALPQNLADNKRKVRRLMVRMTAAIGWLEPSDRPALRTWCELEILGRGVWSHLVSRGWIVASSGEPKRLLSEWRQLKATQAKIAASIGLDPTSRLALRGASKAAVFDIPAAMVELQESENRERAERKVKGDDDPNPT